MYNFDLDILQDGITAPIPTQHLQIEMAKVIKNGASAGVQFAEPGKQYNVNLIVYGAEEVVITVTLSDWEEVGEINIDPDEQDEIDTYTATLTLDPATITMGGTSLSSTASVTVKDKENNTVSEGLTITCASRNTNVATVEGNTITAVGAGTTKIVAYITIAGVQGTLVASADLTVYPDPETLPTAVVTAAAKNTNSEPVTEWTYDAAVDITISGSATVNNVDVDGGTWSYDVVNNDYFNVNPETGVVTRKVNPYVQNPSQPVVVEFSATLADKAGVYKGSYGIVTITVNPAA